MSGVGTEIEMMRDEGERDRYLFLFLLDQMEDRDRLVVLVRL